MEWMNQSPFFNDHLPNSQSFRPNFGSSAGSIALTTKQKALITGQMGNRFENKEKPVTSHRPLTRTTSCGVFNPPLRPSALNQHRALQRSTSYDTNRLNQSMPTLGSRSLGLSNSTSPASSGINTSSNGYRSRETGVIEKLLLSYGFIRCADREGRLFFHYSQFHGEAPSLHINDEVEFDVSMDTRTGKPVAVQVVKLKKGTVVFEVYSEERILGEVASPAVPQGGPQPFMGTGSNGFKPGERGEIIPGGKYGSLCYDRMGEVFFLPYTVNDLTNKSIQLEAGDKVSFYIATEKRTGVLRARKITLVERAPPKRFTGIVTAMKESFGFIERADVVKEIFFHYSEVSNNVPDLHIGDHAEFSIQERNGKEVATDVSLLPRGSVQLEEISNEIFIGTVEKPLPPKAPNKLQQTITSNNAGGDASTLNISNKSTNGNGSLQTSQQPCLTLAGIIQYTTSLGESRKIRFGEKDRAANCLYTLRQGDKVSFLTVSDKRNGQQRAAGVNLLLNETIDSNGEKRERGIVAAVKEGFGFIKCLERDSRLFFHCCELLDPNHNVRMSDEVEFTVLNDPVAEKHRLHATRISILPKGTVIFHTVSEETYQGIVELLPGSAAGANPDCLISPALGPNPGLISYEADQENHQIPFTMKEFLEWTDASVLSIGSEVEFRICTVKRTSARNAVDIKLAKLAVSTSDMIRTIVSGLSTLPVTESSATSAVNHTTPRTPIITPPMKMVPLIEDVTVSAEAFKLDPVPEKKTLFASSPKLSPSRPTVPLLTSVRTSNGSNGLSSKLETALSPRSKDLSSEVKEEKMLGWISTLKETFGFIETSDHMSEIFFHFSELLDSPEKYNVNTPVVYIKGVKDEKPCALQVTIANEKELTFKEDIDPTIYEGIVVKALKSANQTQGMYHGTIEYKGNPLDTEAKQVLYSPISLNDRRDLVQSSDKVTFQICHDSVNNTSRAINVTVKRDIIQATIESIKGEYGFINYEVKNADASSTGKLFFHMSEVREGADEMTTGTLVEFSVIFNQRTGKHSASNIRCLESKRQRPMRLRVRSACIDQSGPVVTVIRQPKGPSDDKGFTLQRHSSNNDSSEPDSMKAESSN